jgi:hypothetical protein
VSSGFIGMESLLAGAVTGSAILSFGGASHFAQFSVGTAALILGIFTIGQIYLLWKVPSPVCGCHANARKIGPFSIARSGALSLICIALTAAGQPGI